MNKAHLSRIAELYDLLRHDGGYLFDKFATKDDEEAAIELFEYETLICPADWKMLNGYETLHPLDKAALEGPVLFGTRLLRLPASKEDENATYEIGHLDHVLRYARNLEELRQLCYRCMTEPEVGPIPPSSQRCGSR